MMENTHNSELSSYTTPEGGTEEKKVTEPKEVVSERKDDSDRKEDPETASNGISTDKIGGDKPRKDENDGGDPISDTTGSVVKAEDLETKEEETDKTFKTEEATEAKKAQEPQEHQDPQAESAESDINTSPKSSSVENIDQLVEETKDTDATEPPVNEATSEVSEAPEAPDTAEIKETVGQTKSETKESQGKLAEETKREKGKDTEESTPLTGGKVSVEENIPVSVDSTKIQQEALKDVSTADTSKQSEVAEPNDKSEETSDNKDQTSITDEVTADETKEPATPDENEVVTEKPVAEKSLDADKNEETEKEKEKDQDFPVDHDFSKYTLEQIVDLIKKLARYQDMIKAEKIVHRFNNRVDELKKQARDEALKKFVADGGEEQDFNYKPDELFERIDANTRLIHDRRHTYIKDLERQKEENLAKAEVLLERLRDFLDGSESNSSFKVFKEIQTEWKTLGPLPGTQYKSLWANYNALVNRFYDTRSIYFELKELDRKKNLEYKVHLCERAESLEDVKDLKRAIIQLNELHNEFKHTGPVPLSDQEPVWQRFKAASDKVYARRKVYNNELKHELKANLQIKSEIADEIIKFTEFTSDKIRDWNTKTREVLELQKKWEKVGGLPREKAKDINKKFWSSFKTYFHNKNDFFKKLEGQRSENLKIKEELVKEAEGLKNSEEWDETAKKLKALQEKWKEIGPVPEKVRNEVYMKFKAACDFFFDKKREKGHSVSQDYVVNLEKKKDLIAQIKGLIKGEKDIEKLKELQFQFYEVGFVPKSEISSIQNEYNEALNEYIAGMKGIDEADKQTILLENRVEKLRHSPNADKKIHQKEHNLRKQIGKIENDISIWRNNMEFFANTKNAEKLKSDFNKKIVEAANELDRLKKELKVYETA